MAVPKKRKSKSRTRMRRAQHDKVAAKALSECVECGAPKLPHRICLECGTYGGKQVLAEA